MKATQGHSQILPPERSANFLTDKDAVVGTETENSAANTVATYTVPTGKRARISGLNGEVLGITAATSSTATDIVSIQSTFTPEGGAGGAWVHASLSSDVFAAGDRASFLVPTIEMDEGDAILLSQTFIGDAAGAGVVSIKGGMVQQEWDV